MEPNDQKTQEAAEAQKSSFLPDQPSEQTPPATSLAEQPAPKTDVNIKQPTPVLPPKAKKQGSFITVVIAIFVLLALAAVGYLFYQNQQLKNLLISQQNQPTPQPTLIASPTPTATSSATTDWQKYTSNTYSFQISFPEDLAAMKESSVATGSSELYVMKTNYISDNPNKYAINVSVWDNPDEKNLVSWLTYMKESNALPLPSQTFSLVSNYKVDGLDALKFWDDPLSNGAQPGKCVQACPINSVYFVNSGKAYKISVVFYTQVDSTLTNLPDQIYSTFKFIQ